MLKFEARMFDIESSLKAKVDNLEEWLTDIEEARDGSPRPPPVDLLAPKPAAPNLLAGFGPAAGATPTNFTAAIAAVEARVSAVQQKVAGIESDR